MTVAGNKLHRQEQTNQEESAAVEQQIARLDEDIRKLKIDFDIYFNGGAKRPPLEARARLEATVRRVSDNRNLTFAQRYQLNSVISRYASYRELWRRGLKKRGDEII